MQKRKENVLDLTAADCMTKNPVTLARSELAASALRMMEERKITSLLSWTPAGSSKASCTSTICGRCNCSEVFHAQPSAFLTREANWPHADPRNQISGKSSASRQT